MTAAPTRQVRVAPPLWRSGNLIWNFAQRDLKSRFKGSALGWAWSLVVPLASLGIYAVVFGILFRGELPVLPGYGKPLFVVWLFAGLTAWTFFASSINAGISGLIGTGALLKKIYFPSYAPVLGTTLAQGIQSLIELGLYLAVLLVLGNLGWTWLLIPVWVLVLVVFVASMATALAILNVYVRDLAHLVAVALQLLFFATPIIYLLKIVPTSWHGIPMRLLIEWTPMSTFVSVLRDLSYCLTVGDWRKWAAMVAWTLAALGFAYVVVRRRGPDVGEAL
ncbi:MAG: ABC transporter permease [Micrococcales bacterium]|nr:ABC transporter permease [Micrococcales bacterium]MCL2668625.1 ABC transporter permease [Micrococcales bacterium]